MRETSIPADKMVYYASLCKPGTQVLAGIPFPKPHQKFDLAITETNGERRRAELIGVHPERANELVPIEILNEVNDSLVGVLGTVLSRERLGTRRIELLLGNYLVDGQRLNRTVRLASGWYVTFNDVRKS